MGWGEVETVSITRPVLAATADDVGLLRGPLDAAEARVIAAGLRPFSLLTMNQGAVSVFLTQTASSMRSSASRTVDLPPQCIAQLATKTWRPARPRPLQCRGPGLSCLQRFQAIIAWHGRRGGKSDGCPVWRSRSEPPVRSPLLLEPADGYRGVRCQCAVRKPHVEPAPHAVTRRSRLQHVQDLGQLPRSLYFR